jgi:hypothetical protein
VNKKQKLSLNDLKVDSMVTLLDEELAAIGGMIGLATDSFNCNSEIGTNLRCCSSSQHNCCNTITDTGQCCEITKY